MNNETGQNPINPDDPTRRMDGAVDPATGMPLQPRFDPETGEPLQPRFDPETGEPLQPKTDPASAPTEAYQPYAQPAAPVDDTQPMQQPSGSGGGSYSYGTPQQPDAQTQPGFVPGQQPDMNMQQDATASYGQAPVTAQPGYGQPGSYAQPGSSSQPGFSQPGSYGQPGAPVQPGVTMAGGARQGNVVFTLGIISLVAGVLSGIPGLGLVAVALGIVAIVKSGKNKKMGAAHPNDGKGKVMGIIGLVLGIISIIVFTALLVLGVRYGSDQTTGDTGGTSDLVTNIVNREQGTSGSGSIVDSITNTDGPAGNGDSGTTGDTGGTSTTTQNTTTTTTEDLQWIGDSVIGYIQVPDSWIPYDGLTGEDSGLVIAYTDSTGDIYVELSGYTVDTATLADQLYEYNIGDSEYSNVQRTTTTVNGRNAELVTSDFSTGDVVYEYVIDYVEGECTYIFISASPSNIAVADGYIQSFVTSMPTNV